MLKSCWECIVSGRGDDAVYGPSRISLNGYNGSVATPRFNNMSYFRLPKPLNVNDTIIISGPRLEQEKFISIFLTEGMQEPDKENSPFYIKLDTRSGSTQSFEMGTKYQGNTITTQTSEEASNFTEEEFKLELMFRTQNAVDPKLSGSSLPRVEFEHQLENITFLVVEDFKVTELTFKYA